MGKHTKQKILTAAFIVVLLWMLKINAPAQGDTFEHVQCARQSAEVGVIQAGDTWRIVGERHGVSVAELGEFNQHYASKISEPGVGKVYCIPHDNAPVESVENVNAGVCGTVEVGDRYYTGITLTDEMIGNAETIISTGVDLGIPVEGQVIALSTAIVESNLINVDYGDRDSQGLFQQRPSQGWGTVDQITDPVFASTSFYNGISTNPGLTDIAGWQDDDPGEVAADVQRPQSDFRFRYGAAMHDAWSIHVGISNGCHG